MNPTTTAAPDAKSYENYMKNNANRVQLAGRLAAEAGMPEEVLTKLAKPVFDAYIKHLESSKGQPYPADIKEKAWKVVSEKSLRVITNLFITEICIEFLLGVSEDQAKQTLGNESLVRYDLNRLQQKKNAIIDQVESSYVSLAGKISNDIKTALNED